MTDLPAPTSRSTGPVRWLVPLLAGLAVVLLVVTAVLALKVRGGDDTGAAVQADRAEALGVARQQATNLTSLSSRDLETGLARVRALSTGAFLKDLETSLAPLRQQLSTQTFTQTGTLLDSGVVELDGDKAKTILALDQQIANGTRTRTDALRLQIDLVRTDGRWLVDNVIFQPDTVAATGTAPVPSAAPSGSAQPSAQPTTRPTAQPSPSATATSGATP